MKRHKAGVRFHDPSQTGNVTSSDTVPAMDVTDHDPKELREILERLHALREAAKMESLKYYRPPSHLMSLPALHRHRDTNVDRDERRWLSFKDIDGNSSQPLNFTRRRPEKMLETQPETTTADLVSKNNGTVEITNSTLETEVHLDREANITRSNVSDTQIHLEIKLEDSTVTSASYANEANPEMTISEEPNSREVFEDVLSRLQALGDRGKRVLIKLHETMGVKYPEKPQSQAKVKEEIMASVTGSSDELDRLRKVLVEAIDEEKTRPERQQKRRDALSDARAKRELMLGQIELQKELNEDDEPRNYAAEEDLEPDGYAEHHEQVNETTAFDMSNSEFWSSFSSSEEALLECEGLILNLPLTPHSSCHSEADDAETLGAARANALTYRVPANGYYFFVFNSENEVQRNYIRAKFDLQKTRYDVAKTKLRECTNSTDRCDLKLDIFSSQKVVLEVPLRNNDSLWNEQFVIISECEPRTSIYLVCVIAVPILILLFAFQ